MALNYYLVLGDGNFTFSLSLSEKLLRERGDGKTTIVSTSLESLGEVERRTGASETLSSLRSCCCPQLEVLLLHNVDATKLESCDHLKELGVVFDVVIFNFPHTGGKNKVQLNRELLRGFFVSTSRSSLASSSKGELQVTLCAGQGGTPGDSDARGYHNSWKVTEMAAEGGYVLCRMEPFSECDYPGYTPTGYRGHTDKGFHTDGAIRHVFKLPSPSLPSLHPPCYQHDISFWHHSNEFNEDALIDIVRRVGGDFVQDISCIDQYRPQPGVNRVGYCYRVVYGSIWDALSRTQAARLQQLLRQEVEADMGVGLR